MNEIHKKLTYNQINKIKIKKKYLENYIFFLKS